MTEESTIHVERQLDEKMRQTRNKDGKFIKGLSDEQFKRSAHP